MISYRHADILRQFKIQNEPIDVYAEVGKIPPGHNPGFLVGFTKVDCNNKEIEQKFKNILKEFLNEYGYKPNGYRNDFESMSGAESNFAGILMDIKKDPRIKSLENKMEWVPGSRDKIMHMRITLRG